MSQTRRLAAILAAEVAAYSRLMGADEEGTLERLKALRGELVDPNPVSGLRLSVLARLGFRNVEGVRWAYKEPGIAGCQLRHLA